MKQFLEELDLIEQQSTKYEQVFAKEEQDEALIIQQFQAAIPIAKKLAQHSSNAANLAKQLQSTSKDKKWLSYFENMTEILAGYSQGFQAQSQIFSKLISAAKAKDEETINKLSSQFESVSTQILELSQRMEKLNQDISEEDLSK
ncbi:MAG: hypothetical protein HC908_15800 [Calothrix sp. SM1_7_51]|nr:hypothetical protein [Calothrix sp. SM1_7_51]